MNLAVSLGFKGFKSRVTAGYEFAKITYMISVQKISTEIVGELNNLIIWKISIIYILSMSRSDD